MTSETSENTIFVWFYSIRRYLMLTAPNSIIILLLRLLLSQTGLNRMTTCMAVQFKVSSKDIFRIAWTRISNRNQRCCFVTQSKIVSLELRDKTRAFEGTARIQLRAILF